MDKEPFISDFAQEDLDEALKLFLEPITENVKSYDLKVDALKIAELAIKSVIKRQSYMGETGVVIAGFGDKSYFPGYQQYKCFGNILGKSAYKQEEGQEGFQIDYQKHSHIKGFATTHMVDTFQFGIGFESYLNSGESCRKSLQNLAEKLGQSKITDLEEIIEKEVQLFRSSFMQQCREKNFEPLTRVVAALPVDDMADLAETLVTLESLKEKVTKPTESVGGPVDVAVITRGEGLVWIKRKHYFDPHINPRYFQRQSAKA